MFAGPIRKAFPEIKIGVIAAKLAGEAGGTVGTGALADEWNTGLLLCFSIFSRHIKWWWQKR
ncbi:MAG: hypothetical protein IPN09_01375 [Bacteroidetes bacterium]|nr:hypothetical protein [Bacteroidota bacterium]